MDSEHISAEQERIHKKLYKIVEMQAFGTPLERYTGKDLYEFNAALLSLAHPDAGTFKMEYLFYAGLREAGVPHDTIVEAIYRIGTLGSGNVDTK